MFSYLFLAVTILFASGWVSCAVYPDCGPGYWAPPYHHHWHGPPHYYY